MHSAAARLIRGLGVLLLCFPILLHAQVPATATKFTNPLLDSGADPWVTSYDGFYYYTNTTGRNLTLWKTRDMADLRHAEKKVVWTPQPGTAWSKEVWAPELHRWDGKWYIYFAADGGSNQNHRIYVVENAAADPLQGAWTLKGKLNDATDRWAIDADIFEANGTHYLLWSGWQGDTNGEQDIYIARMKNPWTLDSPRSLISAPKYSWEKVGNLPAKNGVAEHVSVNEGPEGLVHGDKVFLVYSASGCWTDRYELGVMEASVSSDLLDRKSWKKFDHPFFQQAPEAGVYAPGHNGFFKSPDGTEDWIIYHANSGPHQGCGAMRSPRMQRFTWNADGTPNFGTPAPSGQPLDKPADSADHLTRSNTP